MHIKYIAALTVVVSGLLPSFAMATSFGPALISVLNPGGNGTYGTYVSLTGISYTGCTNTTSAVVLGTNQNYKKITAALLSAKISQLNVSINTSGSCSGNYSIVSDITLP